jgi:hypothetical protein
VAFEQAGKQVFGGHDQGFRGFFPGSVQGDGVMDPLGVLVICVAWLLLLGAFLGSDWLRERHYQKRSRGDMYYRER